ncbi:hypothetical protein [Streptomyces sviceus]|uniref:hypothetical protein n=1 Tax=Streptomyces sviceus TaxID=285530 RepID=UPI0036795C46
MEGVAGQGVGRRGGLGAAQGDDERHEVVGDSETADAEQHLTDGGVPRDGHPGAVEPLATGWGASGERVYSGKTTEHQAGPVPIQDDGQYGGGVARADDPYWHTTARADDPHRHTTGRTARDRHPLVVRLP